jgi:hypothetical protein
MTAAAVTHFVLTLSDLLPMRVVPDFELAGQCPSENCSTSAMASTGCPARQPKRLFSRCISDQTN